MVVKAALSQKQQAFVEYIVAGETQRSAYRKAGYACNTNEIIDVNASRLLSNARVSLALETLRNKMAIKSEWNVARLLNVWEEVIGRSLQAIPVCDSKGEPTGEYRYDSAGVNKAAENIAKIIGAYQQTDGNTLIINQFMNRVQEKYGMITAE